MIKRLLKWPKIIGKVITSGVKKRRRHSKWTFRSPASGYYSWTSRDGRVVSVRPLHSISTSGYVTNVVIPEQANRSLTNGAVDLNTALIIADLYMATGEQFHEEELENEELYSFTVIDRDKVGR